MKIRTRAHDFFQSPYIPIFFLSFIVLGAWVLITKHSWSDGHLRKGIGSAVGILGYTLFAFSLFLSSRWKKLEDWIGGLDQIYHLHHKIGIWGFYFLLAHPLIIALKWLPHRFDKFLLFTFPVHHRLSMNFGSYAYWLMILIIIVTIFKLMPYDKWKIAHKFMTVVFILASLHILFSSRRFDPSLISLAPLFLPMCLGLFGIFHKQVAIPLFFRSSKYVVTEVQKLNEKVLMIHLTSQQRPLNIVPGQYAFFSFRKGLSKEQHPFTICDVHQTSISVLVKARGDFTKVLYHKLAKGTLATLEGPYGRFNYRSGGKNQVWLAGGIGIAPFLAWRDSLKNWSGKIDLFYCVHQKEDALFLSHLQDLQSQNLIHLHLYCSEEKQTLKIENIIDAVSDLLEREVFMCGPRRLTQDFLEQFQKIGLKRRNIHFEDFEFF